MSESKIDENLIATLEMSLRQTRNAQKRLQMQLRELETEANTLREEIEAMDKGAEQTEAAIHSLLAAINSGNHSRNVMKGLRVDEDYQLPDDLDSSVRRNRRIPNERPPQRYRPREYRREEFRDDSVSYLDKKRGAQNNGRTLEPMSDRFSDRTITQACTLLLRETGEALHVNELYNLLVEGGFEFKGNNPTISIAVSLNRNTRFRKVAPGTFDLIIRDASQTGS